MYWPTLTTFGLLAVGASAELLKCNADNCLRGMRHLLDAAIGQTWN